MLSVPQAGPASPPVLFARRLSSSLFWQPTMLALPEPYRPLAIDPHGYGGTDPEPVDARAGCMIPPMIWPPPSRSSAWPPSP